MAENGAQYNIVQYIIVGIGQWRMRRELVYATQFCLSSKFLKMVSDYLWSPVAVPYSSFVFYRVLIINENKNKNTSQLIKNKLFSVQQT